MFPVIQTKNITKKYKNLYAVKDVSLKVHKGEIYGFIGLNGAGKTTVIRMLLGMIQPSRGNCFLHGQQVSPNNIHLWQDVGYLVETPYFYPELTVRENLEIYRRLRLISKREITDQMMQKLRLTRYAETKAGQLSLGNAQRLGIAKALLHQPKLLILDEPTNGLDPTGIVEIRELLLNLARKEGVTIFMSSHLLSEVAQIATKVGIIHEGQLIQELEASALHSLLKRRLVLQTRDNLKAQEKLKKAGFSTETLDSFISIQQKKALKNPDKIARFLADKGLPPMQMYIDGENLESYFLRVIRKKGATLV